MLPELFQSFHFILASASPRRQVLFRDMGFDFTVEIREIDESIPDGFPGEVIAEHLALAKATAFTQEDLPPGHILITADTIVWHQERVLGKPQSAAEARAMLTALSGSRHEVYTGVCLKSRHQQRSFNDVTEVYFRELTAVQIAFYVENFKPFDKAGAYGVQEWIGYIGVEKIVGSFYNVMGLPTTLLFSQLTEFLQREKDYLG